MRYIYVRPFSEPTFAPRLDLLELGRIESREPGLDDVLEDATGDDSDQERHLLVVVAERLPGLWRIEQPVCVGHGLAQAVGPPPFVWQRANVDAGPQPQ